MRKLGEHLDCVHLKLVERTCKWHSALKTKARVSFRYCDCIIQISYWICPYHPTMACLEPRKTRYHNKCWLLWTDISAYPVRPCCPLLTIRERKVLVKSARGYRDYPADAGVPTLRVSLYWKLIYEYSKGAGVTTPWQPLGIWYPLSSWLLECRGRRTSGSLKWLPNFYTPFGPSHGSPRWVGLKRDEHKVVSKRVVGRDKNKWEGWIMLWRCW